MDCFAREHSKIGGGYFGIHTNRKQTFARRIMREFLWAMKYIALGTIAGLIIAIIRNAL